LLLAVCCATPAPTQDPGGPGEELPALLKEQPVQADPRDDDLRKLLKERYNEAVAEVAVRYQRLLGGVETPDSVFAGAQRLVRAGLELKEKPADQVALREKYVALAKAVEKSVEERVQAGTKSYGPADLHQAKYERADAEIQLLRAKERAKAERK
jgi:hypothetical protein